MFLTYFLEPMFLNHVLEPMFLNHVLDLEPIFLNIVLDQGFYNGWPIAEEIKGLAKESIKM